jgi:hypothetical protein
MSAAAPVPDDAIEAAWEAYEGTDVSSEGIRAILAAAVPALTRAAVEAEKQRMNKWVETHAEGLVADAARAVTQRAVEAERERILNVLWETGCSHPWVSEDGKTKRWLGGWCHACYDDIIQPLEVALGHEERIARTGGTP